jgi:hypothetical protein
VFDEMAARTFLLNFAILFGGVDLNNKWSIVVVVVCKMVLVVSRLPLVNLISSNGERVNPDGQHTKCSP